MWVSWENGKRGNIKKLKLSYFKNSIFFFQNAGFIQSLSYEIDMLDFLLDNNDGFMIEIAEQHLNNNLDTELTQLALKKITKISKNN